MEVEGIVKEIVNCLSIGSKVITFGVGGNAANAIHFSAEMAGKYQAYETPLSCIDICSNPSIITAIANDFGWDHVFERQLMGLVKPRDVVLAFSVSTDGNYLHNAIYQTLGRGGTFILICGKITKSLLTGVLVLEVGNLDTPRVQEEQLTLVHRICRGVKSNF